MRIRLVEKDQIVEARGDSQEMVSLVPLLLDVIKPERVTFSMLEGSCALLWNSKKCK